MGSQAYLELKKSIRRLIGLRAARQRADLPSNEGLCPLATDAFFFRILVKTRGDRCVVL